MTLYEALHNIKDSNVIGGLVTYEGHSFASDGKLFVRTNDVVEGVEVTDAKSKLIMGTRILLQGKSSDFVSITIPEENKPVCMTCNGTGKSAVCDECSGKGILMFGYNGIHGNYEMDGECPHCKGAGVIDSDNEACKTCHGTGTYCEDGNIKIGAKRLAIRYIENILTWFDDVEFAIDDDEDNREKPQKFVFKGGEGVILPLTNPGSDPIEVALKKGNGIVIGNG